MRRFSQRSGLVTLSEINITPLLDLAFVLLIIFVITTPLLEQSLQLKLPTGGEPSPKVDPRDVRVVEVNPQGGYRLKGATMKLDDIVNLLARDFRADKNLVLSIRADEKGQYGPVYLLMDRCRKNGITRMDFKSEPPRPR